MTSILIQRIASQKQEIDFLLTKIEKLFIESNMEKLKQDSQKARSFTIELDATMNDMRRLSQEVPPQFSNSKGLIQAYFLLTTLLRSQLQECLPSH